MTIKEATESLANHLNDDEAFTVWCNEESIVVDVHYIYRLPEVEEVGKEWNGFPIRIGRRSCW